MFISVQTCEKWGETKAKWDQAPWYWSECHCPIWGLEETKWSDANWRWPLCYYELTPPAPQPEGLPSHYFGVDAMTLVPPWSEYPLPRYEEDERKRKRIIDLIVGMKNDRFNSRKEIRKPNITLRIGEVKTKTRESDPIGVNIKLGD